MLSLRLKDLKIVFINCSLNLPAVYLPDIKACIVAWSSYDK